MKIETYFPGPVLRPFIKEYKIIESDEGAINRVLPDISIVMAFRFNMPPITVNGFTTVAANSVVSGISKTIRNISYARGVKTILVLFKEGGAAPFLKLPLHELLASTARLDDLLSPYRTKEIECRLNEAKTNSQKISIVESFLLNGLTGQTMDPVILYATQAIKKNNGNISIRQLANSLNISLDPFEKKFRRAVGTTPKHFSTIIKLRHSIQLHTASHSLTELAYEIGYFDQTHFTKDFKRFTGQKPTDFFKSTEAW